MTTYNTGNPIGSTDARDRLDNSENMDILENSVTLNEHPDRLGVMRKTRRGMELEHDNQISAHEIEHDAQISAHESEHDAQISAHESEHDAQISAHESEHDAQISAHESEFNIKMAGMAFSMVGTFAAGYTLTDARQTLLYATDGHEYGWTGAFPKVVPPASTPSGTGGVGAGAWVDRTDLMLRVELESKGATIENIANVPVHLYSIRYFDDARVMYGFNRTASDNTSALNAFIASNNTDLVILEDYKIAQNVTIPKTKNIYFFRNAKLISTAGTLTVNAKVCADSTPVAANGGAVLVSDYAISVGTSGDFTTIQDAINSVPSTQWQRFNIRIADGTYDEDVVIANKWAASYTIGNAGGERTGLYVYGANRTNVLVKSCSMIGSGGASFTPAFGVCTIYGANEKTNENSSFEAYGCPSAAIIDIQFTPTTDTDKAIMSYGSVLSVEKVDFADNLYNDFFVVKHGGRIQQNGNARQGIYTSPTGTCKRYVSNPVSGRIDFMDTSGLRSSAGTKFRLGGAMNGTAYDSASRSLLGPANFRDVLSTYQTYFVNLSDFTVFNNLSAVTAIDATRGLSLTPAATVGSYASAFLRRTHTIGSQQINYNQQLLAAVILPVSMTGVSFLIGIGSGNPSIYIEVTETTVTGYFRDDSGVVTSIYITDTSNILGDNCVFNILVERNNTSTATNKANAYFKISTDTFEVYSSIIGVVTASKNQHEWYTRCYSVTGAIQTVYVSELRLYRE